MPDTVQDGQFLNGLKHKIRAIINDLDDYPTEVFENTSNEAHEIRHEIHILLMTFTGHGLSMEEHKSVDEEEIQHAIKAVRHQLATMDGYNGEEVHHSNASVILTQVCTFDVRHWAHQDGLRFQKAWDAAGRK